MPVPFTPPPAARRPRTPRRRAGSGRRTRPSPAPPRPLRPGRAAAQRACAAAHDPIAHPRSSSRSVDDGASLRASRVTAKDASVENHAPMRALIVTNMWPTARSPRSGASCATRSTRCAARRRRRRGLRVPAGRLPARRARRCAAARRGLRRRPRALRAHRLARAGACAARAARRDAPRHRRAPPALAADHRAPRCRLRPRRRRQPRARARGARRRRAPARRGAAVRRRPRPLRPIAARRGARAARPATRRPLPALPRRPRAAGKRSDRARRSPSARARNS